MVGYERAATGGRLVEQSAQGMWWHATWLQWFAVASHSIVQSVLLRIVCPVL